MSIFLQNPRDRRQLQRLVVSHYLLAALQALVAAILVVMLMTSTPQSEKVSRVWGVDGFWLVASAIAVLAGLTVLAGRRLAEHRGYSFCLTVAALNCFSFPFGTVVGVLTLIVLKRPSVREVFADRRSHMANVRAWEDRTIP